MATKIELARIAQEALAAKKNGQIDKFIQDKKMAKKLINSTLVDELKPDNLVLNPINKEKSLAKDIPNNTNILNEQTASGLASKRSLFASLVKRQVQVENTISKYLSGDNELSSDEIKENSVEPVKIIEPVKTIDIAKTPVTIVDIPEIISPKIDADLINESNIKDVIENNNDSNQKSINIIDNINEKTLSKKSISTLQRFTSLSKSGKERKFRKDNEENKLNEPPKVPDPEWLCNEIPAGSKYTLEEWNAAKDNGKNCVFEIHNSGQSALMTIKKAPQITPVKVYDPIIMKNIEVYPEVDPKDVAGSLNYYMESVWDECLLLAPSATTNYPNSVSGELTFRTNNKLFNDMNYRIIRPESHQEKLFWLYGLKGAFDALAIGFPCSKEEGEQVLKEGKIESDASDKSAAISALQILKEQQQAYIDEVEEENRLKRTQSHAA